MDPINEHDPTMDAHIVHAVNVNNKKEVADMKFLTKSLANARHVQEGIHRQEAKDLIRQLWKLQQEKERRHSEADDAAHGLHRLSSEQIEGWPSSRRGSYNVLNRGSNHRYNPHPPSPPHHHRVHVDKTSHTGGAPEMSHPTTSYHYHSHPKGHMYAHDRNYDTSSHHLPFSGTSSQHFNPERFVHHHRPEYYPMPLSHRRHSTSDYQPPVGTPGVVSQSSRLNAIVQPAGYGHSIAEHAAHLGMHKHYHRGVPHYAHRNLSHGHAGHPSYPSDDVHNIGSYESLTRYINLLDYQASEESKAERRRKWALHHKSVDKQGPGAHHPKELGGGREQSGKEVIKGVGGACSVPGSNKKETEEKTSDRKENSGEAVPLDESETKLNGAKPKSIGFTSGPRTTPSPAAQVIKETTKGEPTGKDTGHPHPRVEDRGARSLDKVDPSGTPRTMQGKTGKGTTAIGVNAPAKRSSQRGLNKSRERGLDAHASRGEVVPRGSNHHQYISKHPSQKASRHHPQHPLAPQILSDLHAIATQSSHHNRHSSTHHPDPHHHHHHHHHQPAVAHVHPHHSHHKEPVTVAERKRMALELLAREYPVLLRHAPTKFDPMEALMCRNLRLSSTNVETLEEMCRQAGIEVGAHAHHQIEDAVEYVFGSEKP